MDGKKMATKKVKKDVKKDVKKAVTKVAKKAFAKAVLKKKKVKKAVTAKSAKVTPVVKKAAKKATPRNMPLLERIELAISTKHGPEAIMNFKDGARKVPVAFSTGIPELDVTVGVGGYPKGRIIEIYGPESSGKTTLTLHAIAECQKAGGTAQFIDAEHALDVEYAQNLGVDLNNMLISQPDSGEMALNIAESAMSEIMKTPEKDRKPNIIVVDSVAALTPKSEIEGEIDKHGGTAEQARMMSKALRKLVGLVGKSGTVLIFINQTRDKLNFGFGGKSGKGTTGGNALKFYASIRIEVKHIGQEKIGEEVIGNNTQVRVVKNKVAPPFKSFVSLIRFGVGFDLKHGRYKALLTKEEVVRSGSWVNLPNGEKFQGYNGFLKFIEDEENDKYISNLLSGEATAEEEETEVEDTASDESDEVFGDVQTEDDASETEDDDVENDE